MDETLEELHARRFMALQCLKIASEADDDDPRKSPAIAEYNRQLANIDAKIAEITGSPPDIVVGLKTAVLFPREGHSSVKGKGD